MNSSVFITLISLAIIGALAYFASAIFGWFKEKNKKKGIEDESQDNKEIQEDKIPKTFQDLVEQVKSELDQNDDEKELENIFKFFGDEKEAKYIARNIIKERSKNEIDTKSLVKIIDKSKKRKNFKVHNATKVFQSLRIFVNREISELINGLIKAFDLLPVGGIIVVVTFHSIEDKIVKFFFKNYSEIKNSSRYIPNKSNKIKRFLLKNKKPITPSNEELKLNPPSRSAKLRFAIKTTHESNFDEFKGKFRQLTDIEKLQFEK